MQSVAMPPQANDDLERLHEKDEMAGRSKRHGDPNGHLQKRVFGLPLRWLLVIAAVLVLAVTGATLGGVLGTRAGSNTSSSSPPAVSTLFATPISPPSSTSSPYRPSSISSASLPVSTAVSATFDPTKWYHIRSSDLSLDQNILSYTNSSNTIIVSLVPYFSLGLLNEHYWQFLPAASSSPLQTPKRPLYFLHNRAAGPSLRLDIAPKDEGEGSHLIFRKPDEEERGQYWYIEQKEGFVVIRNMKSRDAYLLTGRSDWQRVKMSGERNGKEFWEGPPRGSRRFLVKESGVDVVVEEGWVVV